MKSWSTVCSVSAVCVSTRSSLVGIENFAIVALLDFHGLCVGAQVHIHSHEDKYREMCKTVSMRIFCTYAAFIFQISVFNKYWPIFTSELKYGLNIGYSSYLNNTNTNLYSTAFAVVTTCVTTDNVVFDR